ncbi:MAG: bis(5'-nucleosyl)-tetraphosphatase (symmetrical) YqeK [Actinobacteria bacterium]|nr:bis(5'-nucleosyl)-tetraphosphatase (symmetrical) YqeK [Actinomycetota bacterium]
MDFIDDLNLCNEQKNYIFSLAEKLKTSMSPELYYHTIGTLNYSKKLSLLYIDDRNKKAHYRLYVSCLLHDYGRMFGYEELIEVARNNHLKIREFELKLPPLLHGLVGDFLVARDFGIQDKRILKAIKYHTIGYCNMSIEDKILFISDKIEETRDYEGVERLRKLSLKDINLCLAEVYKNTIIYVIKENKLLHPDTSKIWNNICGGVINVSKK